MIVSQLSSCCVDHRCLFEFNHGPKKREIRVWKLNRSSKKFGKFTFSWKDGSAGNWVNNWWKGNLRYPVSHHWSTGAYPQSWPVVITVFTHIVRPYIRLYVSPSVPTFQNLSKQESLWVWPRGSLMTHVFFLQ